AVEAHRPGVKRLEAAESQTAGAEHGRLTVLPRRGPTGTVVAQPKYSTIRKSDVDLDVVGCPVGRDGLNSDARQPDCPAVIDHPKADRIPHLRVVGPLREYPLT